MEKRRIKRIIQKIAISLAIILAVPNVPMVQNLGLEYTEVHANEPEYNVCVYLGAYCYGEKLILITELIPDDNQNCPYAPTGSISFKYRTLVNNDEEPVEEPVEEPAFEIMQNVNKINDNRYEWDVPADLFGKTIVVRANYLGDNFYIPENSDIEVKLMSPIINSILKIERDGNTYFTTISHSAFDQEEGAHYYYKITPYNASGYDNLSAEELRETVYNLYTSEALNENPYYGYGDINSIETQTSTNIMFNGAYLPEGFYVLQCVIEDVSESDYPFGNLSNKIISDVFHTPLVFTAADLTATCSDELVYTGTELTPEVTLSVNSASTDALRKEEAANWLAGIADDSDASISYKFKQIADYDGTEVTNAVTGSAINAAGTYSIYASGTYLDDSIAENESLGEVTVNRNSSTLSISATVNGQNQTVTLSGSVSEIENGPAPTGTLNYEYSFDKITWLSIANGKGLGETNAFTWNVSEDAQYEYFWIRATYSGDSIYDSSTSNNCDIDLKAPDISGVEEECEYNGPVTVSVSDQNLSSVTIMEENDEQATNIPISNGSATYDVTDLGIYTVTARDTIGNESTCSFIIGQEEITIIANNDTTITYAPSATFDVSDLFVIPENAGTATYSVIASSAEGAGAGSLGSDKKTLTITKAGTITIKVNTAGSTYVAPAEQTATLLVNKATITNDMFSLNKSSYDYIVGETYTPVVTVKEGFNLTEGTDYEVDTTTSTQSANETGTYTINVKGIGNYIGSVGIEWTIAKTDTTNPTISGVVNGNTYNEKVTVSASDANLSTVTIKKDSDEATEITVSNGTASKEISDLGSYTVTATDKSGNVTTCSFTIAQENITITAKTAAEDTTITYAPSATFDVSGLFVIPENAGTATYSVIASSAEGAGAGTLGEDGKTLNITKAGTITIKVNTTGSDYVAPAEKTATLSVNKATITSDMFSLNKSSYDYVVGETYTPVVTVKVGVNLTEGTDYEVVTTTSIQSASEIGTYTINIKGIGNYTGSVGIEWTIAKTDTTNPTISGVGNEQTYNGKVTVSVSDANLSSVTIKKDNDEATEITVSNGTASKEVSDLGSYILTATDKAGNVSTCSFTIAQENITITAKTAVEDTTITYVPSATFDVSSLFEIPQNAGTATYSVIASSAEGAGAGSLGSDKKTLIITKAGTITIEVRTAGSTYVAPSEKTATLLVNKATVTSDMFSLNKSSFDFVVGESYTPELNVKEGFNLTEGTDYEIDTSSTQSASTIGTYTIKVNGIGNYTNSVSYIWKIEKTDNTDPVISGIVNGKTYNGEVTVNVSDANLSSVTIKKDSNEATNITVSNGTASQKVSDLGTYTVTATDKAGNESSCSFTIEQEKITITAKTAAEDTIITFDPNATFDVSSLFTIIGNAGIATYSIVPDETATAGVGSLGVDGKSLSVTKAGTITIKVNTAESTYIAPAEATATLTVNKAKGNINVIINNITYGTAVSPVVSSTTNTGNYSIVYKNNAITNDAIASNIPVEVGSYTATVTYPENDLYEKVVKSVNFEITPATLTVVANNIIKKVGSKDPELTYVVNGLQYNDTVTTVLSGNLVRSIGEEAEKVYPILIGDLKANKNYTISFTGATFTITPKDIYTVSIEKNINEAGDVTESGSYVEGSEVTLTATANSGYKFVEWQGKETKAKVSDLSSFKYTVSSNRNLVAVFEKKKDLTLTLTAVSGTYGDSNIGDVTLKVFDGDVSLNIFDEKVKDITEYFTDESCSLKTNTINGADTEGGIPKFVGTYYVKVTVPETENYNSASVKTSFTINASEPGPGPEPGPEPETNTAIWTKESVDWVANFNDDSKTAKATFHLKDNSTPANSVSVDADNIVVVIFLDGTQKTFKATLKYNGYVFEDETTVKMHTKHKWSEPSWDWAGTNATNSVANATFKCTISGQEHQVTLTATTTEKKRKSNKVVYSAVVTGPDKKTYTSAYTLTWTADGNETGKEGDGIKIGNGIVIIGLEDEYDYTGKQIKPAFQVIDKNRNDAVLALNVDYTVKYGANKDAGEKAGTIEVKGKGNYTGAATSATFAIVNRRAELSEDEQKELVNLKGASVRISEKFTYTGAAQYPKSFELKLKGGSWTKYDTEDGITYTAGDNELKAVFTFSNNVNKGTATMLIEGATDDKGKITAVKKTFSIKAADLKDAKFADDMEGTYTVKGAKPDKLVVTWQANDDSEILTLVEGQDFKVKYSDNKAAGTGKIVINGKGNFTKKAEGGTFKINPMKVEKDDISVVVSDKTAANKVKVTILDLDGNTLNQNKQLNVTVNNEEGTDLGKNKVKSGDKIIVNVKSKDTNNVIIDEAGIDVEVLVGTNLSKAKVAVNGYTTTYTGVPVELDDEAFNTIKVTINGKELKIHEDFEIAGYKNNTKKGTMTVTIRGIENTSEGATPVSGTKTFKVKINPKSLN